MRAATARARARGYELAMSRSRASRGGLSWALAASIAAVVAGAPVALAQTAPLPTAPSLTATALYEARVENHREDERHGWVLLGWGAANALAGTAVAIAAPGGDLGRSIGINTAVWGAVNVGISIPWLVGAGRERAAAARDRTELRGSALLDRREQVLRARYGQATVFAVNVGLDVAYVATGVLLSVLATRQGPRDDGLLGVGSTAAVQGGFLLAFDLAGWIMATRRAERVADRVPREER